LFAARIDDRCKFWMSSGGWPWDPTGYVFLARAVQEIGKAMYGAEWTGAEPCTPIPWDHRTGNGRETISRLEVRAVTQGGLDDFRQAVADFRQAVAEIANKRAEADKVALRLAAVQNYIVRNAEAGIIETASRPIAGGKMEPIESWMWNGDCSARFFWCQISRRKPFGYAVGGDDFLFVFLTRSSLDRAVESLHEVRRLRDREQEANTEAAHTSGAEKRATALAANVLRADRTIPKKELRERLEAAGFSLPRRAFDNRVWPDAREAAGLERRAPAGANRKPVATGDAINRSKARRFNRHADEIAAAI
jgi:hypothetical protein